MAIAVSLGGAVIAEAVEDGTLDAYVEALEELPGPEETLVVVTGAGGLKQYIDAASVFAVDESRKDLVGIRATRLHASLLSAALSGNVAVPERLEDVAELAAVHDAVVCGGLVPGQSTDAVAAQAAEIIGADRLVLATTVDGVYDGDPDEDPDAERVDEMSYEELVDLVAEQETGAGRYALIDILAAKLIQRSGIQTVVLDGTDPDVLAQAADGTPPGTLIH